MWTTVIKWFLNPVSIGLVVIALLFGALQHKSHLADTLKIENQAQAQIIEVQKESLKIKNDDMILLDNFSKKQQTIVLKQADTNRKLNEIPDTSTNHPFSNLELDNAASVVRSHQLQAFPTTDSTNTTNW